LIYRRLTGIKGYIHTSIIEDHKKAELNFALGLIPTILHD